jgi:hypothetical protein
MHLRNLPPMLPHSITSAHDFWEPSLRNFGNAQTLTTVTERERAKTLIREVGRLEADWDGYGALPISKMVASNALRFIDVVESQHSKLPNPEISPKSTGTISMEWDSIQGEAYLEIGNSRFSFFIRSKSDEKLLVEGDAGAISDEIPTLVERILYPPVSYSTTVNTITIGI